MEAFVEGEAILQIPPGTPPGVYFLKLGVAGSPGEPDVGEFRLPSPGDKIALAKPASQPAPDLDLVINQELASDLTLLGAEVQSSPILTPRKPQDVTLYWRAEEDVSRQYVVALSLRDGRGREATYWLGYPTHGLYPSQEWRQGDLIRDPWRLDLAEANGPQTVAPGHYALYVAVFESETGQELGHAALGAVEVADRLQSFEVPPMQHSLGAQLGEGISLLGYDLFQEPLTAGARFTVDLYWQARQSMPDDYTAFVQVLGPDGTLVGQHDGVPAQDAAPTSAWAEGEVVRDRHQFDFPILQPGDYRVIVGMYNSATGARLPVASSDALPAGDFLQIETFTIN
jgi:hypothetical protein